MVRVKNYETVSEFVKVMPFPTRYYINARLYGMLFRLISSLAYLPNVNLKVFEKLLWAIGLLVVTTF